MVRSRLSPVGSNPETLTDAIAGPVIISAFLFVAILANFVIRGMYCSCS
jgi:hypothetical protein